jgi:hypothetical protein
MANASGLTREQMSRNPASWSGIGNSPFAFVVGKIINEVVC